MIKGVSIYSRLIWWGTLILLLYSVWIWAGLRPSFHRFAFYGALPLAGLVLLGGPASSRRAVYRDAVFWLGLLFNGYLLLQWSNAGRELVLDPALNQWIYGDPPRPGRPYAFNAAEAWQMITWFFPAWIIAVAIRSPHFGRTAARRFTLVLVASAALLALFGLVQSQSGTKSVYWLVPFNAGFFASFAYVNHATSFFGLMTCVAAGFLFQELFPGEKPRSWMARVIPAITILLGLLALILCGSRAAVFFAAALVIFIAVYGFVRVWKNGKPTQRLHAIGITLLLLALLAISVGGLAKDAIANEFKPKPIRRVTGEYDAPGKVHLTLNLDLRILMAQTGWRVWQSEPWLGVGGWGYKYMAAFHVPEEQWWVITRGGFANVHLDALQYLAEFGIIGFGFLSLAFMIMAIDAVRARRRGNAFFIFAMAALALVTIHSVIDIPFRSPGILYHWVAVLALTPWFCKKDNTNTLNSKL